jgi:uncharacterized protein (DUF2249 family)
MKTEIYNHSKQIAKSISVLTENDFVQPNSFVIDCKHLPTARDEGNIYDYPLYKDFFESLNESYNSPVVYWVQVLNNHNPNDIFQSLSNYKEKFKQNKLTDGRVTPALKKQIDTNSKDTLYVGKVNKDFKGRLVPHLGYYHNSPYTQGLQLCHWAKQIELSVSINYVILPHCLRELTGALEIKLSNQLHPIVGKHRS